MPKVNCLNSAKKAYQEDIENTEIEEVYDALSRHKKMAEDAGANLFEDLNSFSDNVADAQEHAAKVGLYQQILKGQVLADNLLREELFRKANKKTKQSIPRSLFAKMAGSSYKVARARENTYTKQQVAVDKFTGEFAKDLQEDLLPYFSSKTGQKELADAMFAIKDGKKIDTPFGRLAEIFLKYQKLAVEKNKEVGIFINELDNRISPNIHNAEKITSLSWSERSQAKELYPDEYDPNYEFAYQRWKGSIRPKLDEDRTFIRNNVDPRNDTQIDAFLREAFDNVANKGKVSQTNVNYANKFKQQRVLHWKDAQSLVDYNDQFGSGSLQDAIFTELSHQFGMIEVMRDWTINPMDALDSTLELMDKNPITRKRFQKSREYKKLRDTIKDMTTREYPDFGAIATISNSLKTYEAATKLGMVVATSVDDLANTSRVARQLGYNRLQTYGGVIGRFMIGLSKEEKDLYSGLVNTGLATKLSQANRFNMNPYSPRSVLGWVNHWTYKLNLLQRWDNANKAYVTSIVGKYLAKNSKVKWSELSVKDKDIFESYGYNEHEYGVVMKSATTVSKGEKFIMPDTIQDVSDEVIIDSLKAQGIENPSELRIAQYKDAIERKTTLFFRDRMNSSIISPDVIDRGMVTFAEDGTTKGKILHHALSWAMQFKHYGIAWVRKALLPVMRENGAMSTWEGINPFSGKSNWKGLGVFGAERLFLAYVGLTIKSYATGNSRPELDKTKTWAKMLKQTLGPLELAFNVSFSDPQRSIGNFILGAAGGDVVKAGKLISNLYGESREGMGYDKSKQTTYQLLKNGIPFNAILTKWLVNHFILDGMEDWAYPNKRQQDLQQLQQDTGSRKIF